ncbi:MAG: response regulator, partial [Armatimonadetes bacterium]|nr:response regulator [Armatimonadota bacterium]
YGIATDVTEHILAEQARAQLADQMAQSQKLESVGRLAGGVAHDFNNMLAVILGHIELALEEVDPTQPLHEDLLSVQEAARRSADLTRQLLAYARRQTVERRVLDLNETVSGMLRMLNRLIGEDIALVWQPAQELWSVHMDPSQLDQILTNLCVNARDAIGGVGRIVIETSNAQLDDAWSARHPGFAAGDYVRLALSDTGIGMDEATLSQVFEPFFTTKGLGRGTGLGLATVYGIVKQNGGLIEATSEPGVGSQFAIYLPRHGEAVTRPADGAPADVTAPGHETILLVEDEPEVLRLAVRQLQRQGYTVLATGSPLDALRLAGDHAGRIDLLLTDVVMPEMNGRELAATLVSRYPRLRCLYMSGYPADVVAERGVLDAGTDFLPKPFTVKELSAKVREVLGRE